MGTESEVYLLLLPYLRNHFAQWPIQCDWIFLLQIWRKKNQKAHFEHPQNFWKLYQFNVWSAYEFLSLFHFLARWVINLSLIYGHLWWYCSTSDKHVSGNEKGAPHLSCTLAVTQNACTICKNKNIANDEIGAFFKRNWNT